MFTPIGILNMGKTRIIKMLTFEGSHLARVLSAAPSSQLLFCLKSGTRFSPAHLLSSRWWARPLKSQKHHTAQPDLWCPDPTECPALPIQQACAAYPCPPMRSATHGLTKSSSPASTARQPLVLAAILRDPLVTKYSEPIPSLAGVQMSHLRRGPPFLKPWPSPHCDLLLFIELIT